MLATLRVWLSGLTLFQRIAIGNALIIILGAVFGTLITRHLAQQAADWWLILLFASGGVIISLTLNFFIVMAALRPLSDLGQLAKRLQSGEVSDQPAQLKNPDPYTSRMADTLQSLFLQLEERNRELRALSERAITAQEEERRGIAQGLHDDTGQALSMLIIQLDRLDEHYPRTGLILKTGGRDAPSGSQRADRTASHLGRAAPVILDDLGLGPAIRWYARTHLEGAGLQVVVKSSTCLWNSPPILTTTLFRIVQEAGANILRHADAKSATILLQVDDGPGRVACRRRWAWFLPSAPPAMQ